MIFRANQHNDTNAEHPVLQSSFPSPRFKHHYMRCIILWKHWCYSRNVYFVPQNERQWVRCKASIRSGTRQIKACESRTPSARLPDAIQRLLAANTDSGASLRVVRVWSMCALNRITQMGVGRGFAQIKMDKYFLFYFLHPHTTPYKILMFI